MKYGIASIEEISAFDEIIDVRTPAEFAEDCIPGSINCPVLDDDQRIEVGTLYKQVSPFAAKKIGAAYVSENIARHLREKFLDQPKTWRPLIVCWRGGERSAAMTHVLRRIGWNAHQLEGGYKAYRRKILAQLETLPGSFSFVVICGATGSAKSRVLQALARQGQQVLDLEALACHKGSVLGVLPDAAQPSQKMFESLLQFRLQAFDPMQPVYVEAESRRIGSIYLPTSLIERIRASACVCIEAPFEARVDFLLQDYEYFLKAPEWLVSRLETLKELLSRETLDRWKAYSTGGFWRLLVSELLELHYDPLYHRSQHRNFTGFGAPETFIVPNLSPENIEFLARQIAVTREPTQAC